MDVLKACTNCMNCIMSIHTIRHQFIKLILYTFYAFSQLVPENNMEYGMESGIG
jgi:hypothetical protein